MRLAGLGLRRRLAVVLLCTIMASLLWRGTEASAAPPLVTWRRPKDLTGEFFAINSKPIMMLIHKSWCAACNNLKGEMSDPGKAQELVEMSDKFVMVNAVDADEPLDGHFSPDGKYFPRILFLSPDGKVLPEFRCRLRMNPTYQYFYSSASQVAHSMKHVFHHVVANQNATAEARPQQALGLGRELALPEHSEADASTAG